MADNYDTDMSGLLGDIDALTGFSLISIIIHLIILYISIVLLNGNNVEQY